MENEKQITMHFGGGCLYMKCHECGKEVGAVEVAFPGTPEQQKEPREKLERLKESHLELCKYGESK